MNRSFLPQTTSIFPEGNNFQKFKSESHLRGENKKAMMLDEQYSEELRALRNLERAVRAYGLTIHMVSAQKRREMLAAALREVVEARKAAIRRSRRMPLR